MFIALQCVFFDAVLDPVCITFGDRRFGVQLVL